MTPLTKKEIAEHKRLQRKILNGRPTTRKEVLRAFELRRRIKAQAA